jgi:hypothetical protein
MLWCCVQFARYCTDASHIQSTSCTVHIHSTASVAGRGQLQMLLSYVMLVSVQHTLHSLWDRERQRERERQYKELLLLVCMTTYIYVYIYILHIYIYYIHACVTYMHTYIHIQRERESHTLTQTHTHTHTHTHTQIIFDTPSLLKQSTRDVLKLLHNNTRERKRTRNTL